MADKVKVRTTMEPDKEIEVTPEEALDLDRQHVLYKGNATSDAGARRAVEQQQAAAVAGPVEAAVATLTPPAPKAPRKRASRSTAAKTAAPPAAPAAPAPKTANDKQES